MLLKLKDRKNIFLNINQINIYIKTIIAFVKVLMRLSNVNSKGHLLNILVSPASFKNLSSQFEHFLSYF